MPSPPPTGDCKLCGTTTTLRWSHIVPRWTYRRLIQTAAPANAKLVNVRDEIAIFGGEQYADYLLCDACEQRFGNWETYVANIALQTDGRFPALANAMPIAGLAYENWRAVDLAGLQPATLARFAASVIWRASVSAVFPGVSLGTYASAFASYLLDDGVPVPSCARIVLQIIDPAPGPRVDRVVVAPSSSREGGYHMHHFAMFGMWFQVAVGGALPTGFDPFCIARTSHGLITDGARLRHLVAKRATSVTPKAGLARSPTSR